MMRFIIQCLRRPWSVRDCWEDFMQHDPMIAYYREQRSAAVHATREELRDTPPQADPITAMVRGWRRPR